MTFLAIDIGNSNTVLVLFHKGRKAFVAGEWRFATAPEIGQRQLLAHIDLFLAEMGIKGGEIGAIGISSVVPSLTPKFIRAFRKRTAIEPMIVSGTIPLPIRLRYDRPERLGADRICGMIGAREKFRRGAIIVADFGTATTYDVITSKGVYLGGAIAPGVGTSARALFSDTSALMVPPLDFPPTAIGRNTTECLQSGILFGAVDAFEGMVRRFQKILGCRARVVATGGFAGLIASRSGMIGSLEPYLVPEGILAIHRIVANGMPARRR